MTLQSVKFRLTLVLLFAFILTLAGQAQAQEKRYNTRPIQTKDVRKMDKANLRNRARVIRRARTQKIKPADRKKTTANLVKMDVNSDKFRAESGKASLQARAKVFTNKAEQAGAPSTTFTRRLRGMLKVGKRSKVAHHSKTFMEVTSANFELFAKTMGQNTVWFAVNDNPNHLHTITSDQGNKGESFHNVYGVKTDKAGITGNYTQYAMGVHLTDKEMDRFVRYFNAGMKHGYAENTTSGTEGKTTVYGFYTKGGKKITGTDKIKCTNWATTAPVGALPRWAKTVDKRMVKLAGESKLKNINEIKAAGGLHAALAGAKDAGARADLVTRVLKHKMSKWNRSAVKRMAKAFTRELTDFPNRPTDTVLRKSLAETLSLSRSQDPAKWSYDLLMSKRVPVVAVFNSKPDANLKTKTFNWEIMGKIEPSGRVVNGSYYGSDGNQGVIPPERQPQPAAQPATPNQ